LESFWFYRPVSNHPPRPIQTPDELRDSDALAISCTQTDLSPSRQRALVREWCSLLPTLSGVRLLWLTSRVPQTLFDAACQTPGLEGLWVKWSGIKTLEALTDAARLRHFHLGSSTALESLAPLHACTNLESVGLENIKRISELDPLSSLSRLEELSVEGSTWTTQRVDTMTPVGELSELRYLGLANLRSADGTLRPLFKLRKLVHFHAALWWDPAELAQLRSLNPGLVE
jgi:hypothetical protein